MSDEIQVVSDPSVVGGVRPMEGKLYAFVRPAPEWRTVGRFLGISAQLALLFVLLRLFEIEPGAGLPRILPVVFAGFVVHAALPVSWRLPFFLLLSLSVIVMVLGPVPAALLVGIGLCLIGLCHLPIPFPARISLLLVMTVVLASWHAGWIALPSTLMPRVEPPALSKMVLPVLGSMFMFRLIIYLYDLRHEERASAGGSGSAARAGAPASISMRLSYFFLLPNVCFLLFRIVDYRTYRRTYYDNDAQAIYQKGVWWICLGLVYLLAYRVVYHYLVPSPEDVQGLAGIVRFMLASYLVYFRVVGQFHLIIGVLCLFGFNLPPAHQFYLLASNFTDFWRRARIEWKDFMVKVFYYPVIVPVQSKLGPTVALVIATIGVFIATWLLHAYQWFWLRGDFRLSLTDGVFWTIIGGCVLVNSLLEARRGRVAQKRNARWSINTALVLALKVMGMFIFMCILWSYWSSPSGRIWMSYLTALQASGSGEYALLAVVLLGLLGAGVLAHFLAARNTTRPSTPRTAKGQEPRVSIWRPAAVLATAVTLLLVKVPPTNRALATPVRDVVANLSSNSLNAADQEREDRGYYEVLLDEPRSTASWFSAPEGAAVPSPDQGAGEAAEDSDGEFTRDAETAPTVKAPAKADEKTDTTATGKPPGKVDRKPDGPPVTLRFPARQ